jgi:hypothetical protein
MRAPHAFKSLIRRVSVVSPIPAGALKMQPLGNAISIAAPVKFAALASGRRRAAFPPASSGPNVAGTNLVGVAAGASISGGGGAAGANSFFQRNSRAAAIRWRRATADTEFSRTASAALAAYSARLNRRRPVRS